MASEEKDQEPGFTVVDKRAGAGEAEDAAPEAPEAPAVDEQPAGGAPPTVDFSSLCLSLGTSALYHLGVAGDPETGAKAPAANLPLARQTIDILEMLQVKTQGNLEAEETRLLEGMLYELRMRFVEVRNAPGGADGNKAE
jgi:hypothetical protein